MFRPVHFEIHTADPDRTIAFYQALFGWTFQPWGPPGTYWMVVTGTEAPGIDGGMLPRQGPRPGDAQPVSSFVCTVEVPDLDHRLALAAEHGGTVAVGKNPIPTIGWLAYVKDPDGNLVGMMQNDPSAA